MKPSCLYESPLDFVSFLATSVNSDMVLGGALMPASSNASLL